LLAKKCRGDLKIKTTKGFINLHKFMGQER
jgi:hypothetical protein